MNFSSNLSFIKKILLISIYEKFSFPFEKPYKYIFIITNKCNSRCKTCNIWKIYEKKPELMEKELTLEEYEKIFHDIKNDSLWLTLSGGEPFLRNDIDKIAILANRIMENLFFLNIPTNGLMPEVIMEKTKLILDSIRDNIDFHVTISLDGSEEINDEIRGINGSYKKAMTTYRSLKKLEHVFSNFKVSFQVTLSKFNLNNIEKIIKVIKKSRYPIFTFAHENRYFDNLNSGIDFREIQNGLSVEKINLILNSYKIDDVKNLITKIYLKLATKFFANTQKLVLPCFASFATITIDPYGNVLPCAYFSRKIDNLRKNNYDLNGILNSEKISDLRREIKMQKCLKCWTNCEAYPNIFQNFPLAMKKYLL
jgi:MoaA/NifB/PqqE/SkfB family radical SAM enzyme